MEEPRVLYCILKTLKVLFQKQELMKVFLSLPPIGIFSPQEKWCFEIYSVNWRCSAGPRVALSSLTSVLESAFIHHTVSHLALCIHKPLSLSY